MNLFHHNFDIIPPKSATTVPVVSTEELMEEIRKFSYTLIAIFIVIVILVIAIVLIVRKARSNSVDAVVEELLHAEPDDTTK